MTGTLTNGRTRWGVLLVVTAVVLIAAAVYAFTAYQRFQESQTAAPAVGVTAAEPLPDVPFVLFRNTAAGQGYGRAATVPLSAPSGTRAVSEQDCDRVYGTSTSVVCLRSKRGLVTSFDAVVLNRDWQQQKSWPLAGIPSRTRISPDGSMLATTVFVTGHSYAAAGFSTATEIALPDAAPENLESFSLLVNGEPLLSVDRNIWGVTFVPGQKDAFYATAASSGRIWLVRGSVSARTLTAVHNNVECPSISPDGTRLAFKKNDGGGLAAHWKVAILDIASGQESVLSETRSVDDQIEWLDNDSVLYGLPDDAVEGDSNIWKLGTEAGSTPSLFIAHAWSPSVIR